jgi:hypothetical protein
MPGLFPCRRPENIKGRAAANRRGTGVSASGIEVECCVEEKISQIQQRRDVPAHPYQGVQFRAAPDIAREESAP